MAISIYKVYGGGEIEPGAFSGESQNLNEVSRLLPGGVYTTFRTYGGSKVLSLNEHFRRLEESALLLGKPIALDQEAARRALRAALADFHNGEARLRITIDLEQEPGRLYLALESLTTPTAQDYAEGVRAVTCRQQRSNPRAKQTSFISIAEKVRSRIPVGVHEGLIVDRQGTILEGLSSNFFGVRQGVLYTTDEASVLSGITRSLVLEAAQKEGIPVVMQGIRFDEIPALDEAFITSSTRGVLPVRQIDEQEIGDGKVGPVTKALGRLYEAEITKRLEEI